MKALVIVAMLASAADARPNPQKWKRRAERVQGGAFLHYELTGLTALDERMPDAAPHDLVLAGARLHGFFGQGASIAYHVGMDLFAGSTVRDGGFAYDVAVSPIGVIVRFGKTSFAGVSAGIGASGAVGTLDDALTWPLEAVFEAGKSLRVLGRARVTYVSSANAREHGAPSLPFGDELDTMLGLRLGTHYDQHGFPSGNGYFVAANYREQMGARLVGLTIGYSIDLAMPRRWVGREGTAPSNDGF